MARNETFYKGFGVKVILKFVGGAFKGHTETLRNVTEIHKNFNSRYAKFEESKTAFESDIHFQGIVYETKDVKIVSIVKETSKAKSF
jgi:hypothetical protein